MTEEQAEKMINILLEIGKVLERIEERIERVVPE